MKTNLSPLCTVLKFYVHLLLSSQSSKLTIIQASDTILLQKPFALYVSGAYF